MAQVGVQIVQQLSLSRTMQLYTQHKCRAAIFVSNAKVEAHQTLHGQGTDISGSAPVEHWQGSLGQGGRPPGPALEPHPKHHHFRKVCHRCLNLSQRLQECCHPAGRKS